MPATLCHGISGCFEIVANVTARFGYDLDAAFDKPAFALVGLEGGESDAGHLVVDEVDGFNDVGQA